MLEIETDKFLGLVPSLKITTQVTFELRPKVLTYFSTFNVCNKYYNFKNKHYAYFYMTIEIFDIHFN